MASPSTLLPGWPSGPLGDLARLPMLGIGFANGVVGEVVTLARRRLAVDMRKMVVGGDAPLIDMRLPRQGDDGLFGPDSVTWRVHADASMFVGGLRALLLQTMHPEVMAGVADHSGFRSDPLGRLARTASFVAVTTYGSTAEVHQMVNMVRRVHTTVTGTSPNGKPYEANDPHLLLWVHNALVDSFLRTHQRYGAHRLNPGEADQYLAEMAQLNELLGGEPAPTSVADLRQWFRDERPNLGAGSQARDAARWLMVPPIPLAARPMYAVIAGAAVGLLPRSVRRDLRLPLAPGVDPLVVRPAATALVRTLGWVMAGHPELEAGASA
jgi:uncharacterized protein (DUF2236 family)